MCNCEPLPPVPRETKKKDMRVFITISILLAIIATSGAILAIMLIDSYAPLQEDTTEEAMRYGYELAITQLLTEAVKCEAVPIRYNNQTFNMVLIDCLQQGGGQ